jgi:hypothetical protein
VQLLTDEASEQLSRGVSSMAGGLLGVSVVLLLAVVAYSPVGFVLSDTSVAAAVWERLWTDQTPAYLVSSVLAMSLLYVESGLLESTGTKTDESDEQKQTEGLRDKLFDTFKLIIGVNGVIVVVLSGVVAGLLVSETVGAPLSVAAAFVYPVLDFRVAQKTERVPTPITVGAALSAPLAVVPTLCTLPFHIGTTGSKRFASVVDSATDGVLFLATRVTDAVPGSFQLPTRLSPRRWT